MSTHLTSRQISEAMMNTLSPVSQQHLHDCSFCQGQVDRFRSDLALFGSAVRQWGDEQLESRPGARAVSWKRPWHFPLSKFALVGGLLAAASAAIFVGTWRVAEHGANAPVVITDAALLDQVNAELEETVPGPMAPLAKLMSETNKKEGRTAQSSTQ